ncbi:MAG: riboflavin synthase [Pseudomonadota bacterium]
MFTGLITDIGVVQTVQNERFQIMSHYKPEDISIGASIACDGCCLTAISVEPLQDQNNKDCLSVFAVDVSEETKSCTTLSRWQPGQQINLERSMRLGDEMGGHVVTGHVDGVSEILEMREDGTSIRYRFRAPEELAGFIAPKGCVALDGTSLTVNDVSRNEFEVNLIPHTLDVTTWGERKVGDHVNIEIDLLARYVARIQQYNLNSNI